MVLGLEVYGRSNGEVASFVRSLVRLKLKRLDPRLEGLARYTWFRRFWGLLSVGLVLSVASSSIHVTSDDSVTSLGARVPLLSDLV